MHPPVGTSVHIAGGSKARTSDVKGVLVCSTCTVMLNVAPETGQNFIATIAHDIFSSDGTAMTFF